MAYPAKLRYSREHQWIDVSGDMGTIGITDYAQSQLNEIVSVDLPKPGAMLAAGPASWQRGIGENGERNRCARIRGGRRGERNAEELSGKNQF
jgi:hypothetical protein